MSIAKVSKLFQKAKLFLGQKYRASGRDNQQIFDDIYANRRWKGDGDISSGLGSAGGVFTEYEDLIVAYIERENLTSVLDIGCGDFRVAGRILDRVASTVSYTGADVSKAVVEQNTHNHSSENVRFVQLDAVNDDLPRAQLVVIREVLQHLSNADILKLVSKLLSFDHVIISNHDSAKAARVNMDIPTGAATRASFGSALNLSAPPFNFEMQVLLESIDPQTGQRFVSEQLVGTAR